QLSSEHLTSTGSGPLADRVQGFEREVILAELKRNHYHITNASKALGLERSHFYQKAEQLGIDVPALRQESDAAGEEAVPSDGLPYLSPAINSFSIMPHA